MLTRLLSRCGLDLGREGDLMPAAADNPDGFWENLRFVRLNDEILNSVGAAWDLPSGAGQDFAAADLDGIRAKAELLIEEFRGDRIWGWKDPRNCLTLPFWEKLLPGLRTIIIVRNPLEVAYSMHQRNGTSLALGVRLWEIYNRRLLASTRPDARIIADYRMFFENPEQQLRRVTDFAGLPADAAAETAALVARNRRHATFTTEQLIDAGLAREIVALYRSLTDEAASAADVVAPETDESSPSDRPDPLAGAASRINLAVPAAEDVRQELAWRRGTEIQLEKRLQALVQENQRTALELGRREELQAQLELALRREEADRAKLNFELGRERQQLDDLRERFLQINRLLHAQSIRLAEQEARNSSLTERLRKQLRETKRLLRLLDEVEVAAEKLRRSRRWIMGNLLSWIVSKFSGRRLAGFGHLDKNVAKYRTWRAAHPEADHLDDAMAQLTPRETAYPANSPDLGQGEGHRSSSTEHKIAVPTRAIEFPTHEKVEVSIIIPVFNEVQFTQACLASLQEHSDHIAFEVLLVDDCSTDATADLISQLPGIVYLRNEANSGYIASCNRGAAAARGGYLVFLNNDTTVTQGWLASLLETFQLEPKAGLVGSKLIYPDGRLQEAGGIIWRDGSGWNRGKFQDPNRPEFNYLREVSYCSAASIMIPKTLFEDLGGFDRKYAPAYYEDTDLAFKVAQAGRKVLYQPLSVVLHYEGVTSGTDTSSGVKQHQEINRHTFANTWSEVLASLPENGDIDSFNAPREGEKRILVIDHHLPMSDRDSGSLRMLNLLTILLRLNHQVTFLADNMADIPPYGDELRKRGIVFPHNPYFNSVRAYLQLEGRNFDIVILSRCDFARKHIADVREFSPQSRVIFDTVDLHFLRESRLAQMTNDPAAHRIAEEKRQFEYELIDRADETWVVSPTERELIQANRPEATVEVVSNIVDTPGSATPFSERSDILFIGSFQHPPNIDAVLFFAKEIFPSVRAKLPRVRLYVIGDKAPPEIITLSSSDIVITGFQPDVSFYFNSIKLSIAPLRYGAGVKGKINQSMGYGVPVVATSIAAEGMKLTSGQDILIADEPEQFASALVHLYTSAELWNLLSSNSVTKTHQLYSRDAACTQLVQILARTTQSSPNRRGSSF